MKSMIRDESHLFERKLILQVAPAVISILTSMYCTAFGISFEGDLYAVTAKHCLNEAIALLHPIADLAIIKLDNVIMLPQSYTHHF